LTEAKEIRKSGIIMILIFTLFFLLSLSKSHYLLAVFFGILWLQGFAFMVIPERMEKIFVVWMKISHQIGILITGFILVFVYFCLLVPYSILLKMLKIDVFNNRKSSQTYWIDREEKNISPESLKNHF
jgi:uncharacterized membrane protein HdeD (DUF308 family)